MRDYVHLNPVRTRMLEERKPLEGYVWSSFPEYLKPPKQRTGCVERLAKRGHAEAGNSANHLSQTPEETMEEKAREIIRTSLKKQGTGLEAFRSLKKGHPSQVPLARELRQHNHDYGLDSTGIECRSSTDSLESLVEKNRKKRQYAGLPPFFSEEHRAHREVIAPQFGHAKFRGVQSQCSRNRRFVVGPA